MCSQSRTRLTKAKQAERMGNPKLVISHDNVWMSLPQSALSDANYDKILERYDLAWTENRTTTYLERKDSSDKVGN